MVEFATANEDDHGLELGLSMDPGSDRRLDRQVSVKTFHADTPPEPPQPPTPNLPTPTPRGSRPSFFRRGSSLGAGSTRSSAPPPDSLPRPSEDSARTRGPSRCLASVGGCALRVVRRATFWLTCGYCLAWGAECCAPPYESTGDPDEDEANRITRDQFSYSLQARYDKRYKQDLKEAGEFSSEMSPGPPRREIEYPGDFPPVKKKIHALQVHQERTRTQFSSQQSEIETPPMESGRRRRLAAARRSSRFSVKNLSFSTEG